MKLSISNIGWASEKDEQIYSFMHEYGFVGLEIAPTRVFSEKPYQDIEKATKWKRNLKMSRNLDISSMQSIWYGRSENIFGSVAERDALFSYTKGAINFAEAIECRNLVFGCPQNRFIPAGENTEIAVRFFKKLGDYAYEHHTVIALEANPSIYNTNFINSTEDAISFVERVNSKGFLLNLDIGTMIENSEIVDIIEDRTDMINHVHISEPWLKPIQKRSIHQEIAKILRKKEYRRFVSIEVGRQNDVDTLIGMMKYVKEVFG